MSGRGNNTSALVVFLALITTASMAHSQKSAAEDRPEALLQEWQEADQDHEEIQSNFHRMIVNLERAETNAVPPISWQKLCEGLPGAWKKIYRPITQPE